MITYNLRNRYKDKQAGSDEFVYDALLERFHSERDRTLSSRTTMMMKIIGVVLPIGIALLVNNSISIEEPYNLLYIPYLIVLGMAFSLLFLSYLYQYLILTKIQVEYIYPSDELLNNEVLSLKSKMEKTERIKILSQILLNSIKKISDNNRFVAHGIKISDIAFLIFSLMTAMSLMQLFTRIYEYFAVTTSLLIILILPITMIFFLYYGYVFHHIIIYFKKLCDVCHKHTT